MKKIIICLLLSLFLLACVPTPEQEYIVNKGEEKDWQRPVEVVTVPGGTQGAGGVPQNENEFVPNQPTDTETPTESALYETLGAPQYWALDTEVNGVRVYDFFDLTGVIDQLEAGDELELKCYRYEKNGEEYTGRYEELYFTVTLSLLD